MDSHCPEMNQYRSISDIESDVLMYEINCYFYAYLKQLFRFSMSRLIFFIDDDKMILNLLEYTFQSRHDYEVVSFHTGEECLSNLPMNPSVIVLDHILTGTGENNLNGLDTLKEIRKVNNEIPVVILTGQGDETLLTEFMENGANRYLTKDDFFIDSLIETIDQVII